MGVKPGERFDIARAHPVLVRYIDGGAIEPGSRCLVPGCGRGYDVAVLAGGGRSVVGLDLSPTCVAEAKAYLESAAAGAKEPLGQAEVVAGDFFAFSEREDNAGSFDFVFDYTFLCALPPHRRGEWAAAMARLLKPGSGVLMTMQFPLGPYGETHPLGQPLDFTKGPPFLLSKALYHDLLDGDFVCEREEDVAREDSHPKRAGVEAVAVWRRK